MINLNKAILNKVYAKRKSSCHKYDFGHLLIVGGSKLYSGSPALVALAAYKTGVDLATVVAPERVADIVAGFSPDLITYPLKGDYFNRNHLKEVLNLTKNKDAVVIGNGLERRKETISAILDFLKIVNLPCVIDADAIHAIAKDSKIIANKNFVITPHAYEFYMLTGVNLKDKSFNERINLVREFSFKLKTTILLKGHVDIISNGKKIALNKTGCPELTVGGTGDTLAGILGALLARKNDLFDSVCAAAYINGKAGEVAARKFKESVIASDLIDNIYKVIPKN